MWITIEIAWKNGWEIWLKKISFLRFNNYLSRISCGQFSMLFRIFIFYLQLQNIFKYLNQGERCQEPSDLRDPQISENKCKLNVCLSFVFESDRDWTCISRYNWMQIAKLLDNLNLCGTYIFKSRVGLSFYHLFIFYNYSFLLNLKMSVIGVKQDMLRIYIYCFFHRISFWSRRI